ncbi:MAG: lipoate--protein ligase family protein [Bacteroidales bacterium]|nr:lipoate--protein ligase family protein [Bacteroidales bacterium]
MKRILLPCTRTKELVYYLAAEEYVAQALGEGFFVWRTEPCVIFGRNQDMEAEVNVPYCREQGIRMWRRKSGGGCVYSDEGNLMISCIVPGTDVRAAFGSYLESLASALRALGLPAVGTSHNDITVNGRKVSGNACFADKNSCIIHGTLMYDVDFERLEKAITPSAEKLSSHGVKSVRQRVSNLKELGLECGIGELGEHIAGFFSDGTVTLPDDAPERILEIERAYLDPAFIIRPDKI